jgi:hypothetical protein
MKGDVFVTVQKIIEIFCVVQGGWTAHEDRRSLDLRWVRKKLESYSDFDWTPSLPNFKRISGYYHKSSYENDPEGWVFFVMGYNPEDNTRELTLELRALLAPIIPLLTD